MRSDSRSLWPFLALALVLAGCRETTEPAAGHSIAGHVRVIGYLTEANGHFAGTRVEEQADGIPVALLFGTSTAATTRTVRGEYRFEKVANGGYTTRATAPGDLSYESRALVVNDRSVYAHDTLELKSRGDLYPSPNPVVSETWLSFALAESSDIELAVFDVEGGLVKQIRTPGTRYGPGDHEARWDGRTSAGAVAPVGLYWAVFASGSDLRTQALFRDALPVAAPTRAVAKR